MPAPLGSVAMPLFLRWRVEDETIKFAADIARRSARVHVPNPVGGAQVYRFKNFGQRCEVLGFGAEKPQSAVGLNKD